MNRILWLLMLLLLIGTVVGASWAFNNGVIQFGKDKSLHKANGETPPPLTVIALGFVDGERPVVRPLPLVQGRVVEVISEGTQVKQGDVLLKLDSGMYKAAVDEAQAALDDALQKQKQAEALPEQHRLKQLQQQEGILAAKAERKAVELDQDAKLAQAKDGIKVNQNVLDALKEKLKQLNAKVAVEEATLDIIKLHLPDVDMQRAKADVDAKQAQLAKAKWAMDQCTLKAPADGLVLRVTVSAGEVILAGAPGQTVPIEFLPRGPKIVRAEVLQEWANLVQVDQDPEVEIEDDTYQGPTWKGKVRSLSNWFAQKRTRIIEPFMINDVRTLECIVEVTQESPPLRIGQRVRVKIKTK